MNRSEIMNDLEGWKMDELQIQRQTLELLCNAIARIDGGCPTCTKRFIENANEALQKAEIHLEYRWDSEANWGIHSVSVFNLDDGP